MLRALARHVPRSIRLLAIAFALGMMLLVPERSIDAAGPFVVNSTADAADLEPGDGVCNTGADPELLVCTLRAAIQEANALPEPDTINFNIAGPGPHTIAPSSALPDVQSPIVINGYSQPGAFPNSLAVGNNATLLIELNGSLTPGSGLRLFTSNSLIRGLVINRFPGAGIEVTEENNVIAGNFLGTDPTGTIALGNIGDGIFVANYEQPVGNNNTRIGGPDPADRNLISGNGYNSDPDPNQRRNGITLDQVQATIIQNNYIGTDRNGTNTLPNAKAGVGIYRGNGHNIDGNVISGNGTLVPGLLGNGIEYRLDDSPQTGSVTVQNNVIGFKADLTGSLANGGKGIYVIGQAGATTATISNNTVSGNGLEGIDIFNDVSGSIEGTKVQGNGSDGIAITGNARIKLSGNSISGNGGQGIDLAADGITFNHQGTIAGPNRYQNYPLLTIATTGSDALRVAGTLSAPDGAYRIEFFANDECDDGAFGEGQTYLGFVDATASGGSASFDTTLPAIVSEGQGLSATATNKETNETSELSFCRPVSTSNTNWVDAAAIPLEGGSLGTLLGSIDQRIMEIYQEKWFRFPVQPGDRVRITLRSPTGSAISLHRDPLPYYNQLISPGNVAVLSADSADLAFLPSGALPPGTLPSGSLPGGTLPSGSLPPGTLPSGFLPGGTLPSGSLPPGSLPSGSLPPGSLPSGALPPGALPSGSLPPGTLPSGSLPPGALPSGSLPPATLPSGSLPPGALPSGALPPGTLAEPYSGAARRSLMAVSLDPYATEQIIERYTYDLQEDLYVRVVGPYYPTGAFSVDVQVVQGVCAGVQSVPAGTAAISGAQPVNGTLETLILTDSSRLPGTSTEVTAALAKLGQLANRSEVRGTVIDFADTANYPGVAFANTQADANPACPGAKNSVAREIKRVIDAYRGVNVDGTGRGTVDYLVMAGSRGVIPYYQSPDVAGVANEREYVPPVAPDTPSESGLKVGLVQGQDFYGSSVTLNRDGRQFFVPDLAIGRLVETANDVVITVDRYIATNGVVTPRSALVTGYDFVGDTAEAVNAELTAGLNAADCSATGSCVTTDTLIQPEGLPPADPTAWTASQLRAKLIERPVAGSPSFAAGKNDIIVMSGHFSAGNLVAADYETRMAATEVVGAAASYEDSVVLALGCHGGFSIPGADLLSGTSPDPDWAKAFLRRSAAGFIAASGYAYGSTTTIEWGERVFVDLSRQLRTGTDPVALGKALANAKKSYLAKWADQLDGYDEKTLTEMNLYGLPMIKVNLIGQRLPADTDTSIIGSAAPVTAGPGASLNLYQGQPASGAGPNSAVISPQITINTATLQNLNDPSQTVVTSWASGRDGTIVNAFEPLFPRERYNVHVPGYILRGVAFRGGTYTDRNTIDGQPVVPFTEAPTTETSRAHEAFYSDAFYPAQVWLPNFLDAVSGGPERLIAVPGQYKSSAPGSISGTLRTFNQLKFDLYYLPSSWAAANSPAGVKAAAVAAAPAIIGAGASHASGVVTFRVNVQGDDTPGIQGVTILYTAEAGPLYGEWQALDLTEADPATDPTLWQGTLTLPTGQDVGRVQFIAQAINGAGLTTLATNNGAFYTVTPPVPPTPPPPPVATTLSFDSAPASGPYLQSVSFRVRLTGNNAPIPGKLVLVSLAGQQTFATSDSDGYASVTIKPKSLPGAYSVQATYRGESPSGGQGGFTASNASSPFTLTKDNTSLSLTFPSTDPLAGQETGVEALLRDSAGQPLGNKTVFFVLTNGAGVNYSKAVAADIYGVAPLGMLTLPGGTYSLKAYFSGTIDLGNGETITWPDDYYNPSQATGTLSVIAVPPPTVDSGPDSAIYEGDTFSLAPATFTDPDKPATQTATIDWGDGQSSPGVVTSSNGSGTVAGSHLYPTAGTYRVTVSVADAYGNVGSDFLTLKVVNGFFRGCVFAGDRVATLKLDASGRVGCNITGYGPVQLSKASQASGTVTSIANLITLDESARVDFDLVAAGKISMGKSTLVGRNVTSGGDVSVGISGRVTGNITASGSVTLASGATAGGTITRNAPPPVIPGVTLPTISFTSGTQSVTVAKGATRKLEPGVYGALTLGESATLDLSAGTYVFASVSAGKSSRVNFSLNGGNAVINVVNNVSFGSGTRMSVSGGAAKNVLWQALGSQVSFDTTSASTGTFLAPNATIVLRDGGTVTGALYGKQVQLNTTSVVTGDPAQGLYMSLHLP